MRRGGGQGTMVRGYLSRGQIRKGVTRVPREKQEASVAGAGARRGGMRANGRRCWAAAGGFQPLSGHWVYPEECGNMSCPNTLV